MDKIPTPRDFERLLEGQYLLTRSMDSLTREISALKVEMSATYVRKDNYDKDQQLHATVHQVHLDKLNSISGWTTWANRLVWGALLLGAIDLLSPGGLVG